MIIEVLFSLVLIWLVWLYIRYWHNADNSEYLQPYCKVPIDKPGCYVCLREQQSSPTQNPPIGTSESSGTRGVNQPETISTATSDSVSEKQNDNEGSIHNPPEPKLKVNQEPTPIEVVENSQPESAGESETHTTMLFEASGPPDDLKQIKGIGKVMEKTLNSLGVTTFAQLANFDQVDIDKVTDALEGFTGRIERDRWVEQAQKLVE